MIYKKWHGIGESEMINKDRMVSEFIKLTQIDSLSTKEKEKIVDKLLEIIKENFSINKMQVLNDYKQKRDMLWGLLNQIPPFDFGDEFFKLQNKLLSSETNEKQIKNQPSLE